MPGWESIVTNLDLWLSSSVRGKKLSDAESPIEHLLRLRWLEHTGEGRAARLSITPLGRALLNGAERSQEAEPDLSVVVLSGKDPLAYPALIGHLATLQDGLFIDPFLGLVQLHELILSTQFSRFLITDKANASGKRTAMATYLRSGSVSRSVDVRAATGIHDRMVLSDTESFTLGTSLNGVGKTTTVLSPLPHAAAKALRAEMESAWAAATPLIPEEDVEAANE